MPSGFGMCFKGVVQNLLGLDTRVLPVVDHRQNIVRLLFGDSGTKAVSHVNLCFSDVVAHVVTTFP